MLDYLVEILGTFIFLSVILISEGDPISIGVTLAAMILFGAKISGGHFNPAVTFMMWLNKQKDTTDMVFYMLCQLLGGTLAYLLYDSNRKDLVI